MWRPFAWLWALVHTNSTGPVADPGLDLMTGRNYTFAKFCVADNERCAKLGPQWDAAAERVRGKVDMNWESVDCGAEEDRCVSEGAYGYYPTLWVYRNGKRAYNFANIDASEDDLTLFALQLAKHGGSFVINSEHASPEGFADLDVPLSDAERMNTRATCQFLEFGGLGRGGPDDETCGRVTAADLCTEPGSPPAWIPRGIGSGWDDSGTLHLSVSRTMAECYECDVLQLSESPDDKHMNVDCNEHKALCYVPYVGQFSSLSIMNVTRGAEGRPSFLYIYQT